MTCFTSKICSEKLNISIHAQIICHSNAFKSFHFGKCIGRIDTCISDYLYTLTYHIFPRAKIWPAIIFNMVKSLLFSFHHTAARATHNNNNNDNNNNNNKMLPSKRGCQHYWNSPEVNAMCIYIRAFEHEPRYEKTGFLHMRKQRRRSASR